MPQDGLNSAAFVDQDDMEGDIFDSSYDAYGVGASFSTEGLPLQPQHSDFSTHSELYPLDTSVYTHGLPLSSSGFEYSPVADQHQHGVASSLMSLDTHDYTSPVSSTATLTQGALYGDNQVLPTATMLSARDDLHEMSFDIAFSVSH